MTIASFKYKAANDCGDVVTGVLSGTSRAHVIAQLQATGHVPIRVDESTHRSRPRRVLQLRRRHVTEDQLGVATRELSTLLRAGIPLDDALTIICSTAENEELAQVFRNIHEQVKQGSTLADAMEAQGNLFSRFYLSLLRAGESGGALEAVLSRLADHIDRSKELRGTLISALIYPATLVVVAILSILILLGYVVPQFTQMFEGAGQILPLSTRITIAAGETVRDFGWLLLLLVVAVSLFVRNQLAKPASAYRWHKRILQLPLLGEIIVKIEIARFALTLSTLMQNGLPLLGSLMIVKDTVGNKVLADGLERTAESLREGQNLADPLARIPHFPPFAAHMIRVGEKSGELQEILRDVAAAYERDTQVTIKRALSLLEPALILTLGAIIAAVIISILLAILSINELVI